MYVIGAFVFLLMISMMLESLRNKRKAQQIRSVSRKRVGYRSVGDK